MLQVSQIKQQISDTNNDTAEAYFSQEFFPAIRTGIENIKEKYQDIETRLLNSYQELRKEKLARTG